MPEKKFASEASDLIGRLRFILKHQNMDVLTRPAAVSDEPWNRPIVNGVFGYADQERRQGNTNPIPTD
jgi:hypothetical protein